MKEIWCCFEGPNPEYFDSEETALLAYKKWCEVNEEEFDMYIFYKCYGTTKLWTKENIDEYEPDVEEEV